jgi:hypothetical protein
MYALEHLRAPYEPQAAEDLSFLDRQGPLGILVAAHRRFARGMAVASSIAMLSAATSDDGSTGTSACTGHDNGGDAGAGGSLRRRGWSEASGSFWARFPRSHGGHHRRRRNNDDRATGAGRSDLAAAKAALGFLCLTRLREKK